MVENRMTIWRSSFPWLIRCLSWTEAADRVTFSFHVIFFINRSTNKEEKKEYVVLVVEVPLGNQTILTESRTQRTKCLPCHALSPKSFVSKRLPPLHRHMYEKSNDFCFCIPGVRQEQDIYVRLIDSVTKQVSPDNTYFIDFGTVFSTEMEFIRRRTSSRTESLK